MKIFRSPLLKHLFHSIRCNTNLCIKESAPEKNSHSRLHNVSSCKVQVLSFSKSSKLFANLFHFLLMSSNDLSIQLNKQTSQ